MKHGHPFMIATLAVLVNLCGACGTMSDLGNPISALPSFGENADPAKFERHLTEGSKAYASSLAEFNDAIGEADEAETIRAFLKQTPDPWDTPTLKTVLTKAEVAEIPPDAEIIPTKDIASAHVIGSWVLASYAGYLYQEAVSDARKIVSDKQLEDTSASTFGLAVESVKALPSFIKTSKTIVTMSADYMSENGIPKPSPEEITQLIIANVGSVIEEVVLQVFG